MSTDPRALRSDGAETWFKFYEEEGWRLVEANFPRYLVNHRMLDRKVPGISLEDISLVRKPESVLSKRLHSQKDPLTLATENVLAQVANSSGLNEADFGVFGSMLHGFHNPNYSDIDLIIYGGDTLRILAETLASRYSDESSGLSNEFDTFNAIAGKKWRFTNLSPKEYLWHQRRKLIYALFKNNANHRMIKTEFEPVHAWREIANEYDPDGTIESMGWVKMLAKVDKDTEAPFIPSIYSIKPIKIFEGSREASEAIRVISFLEEFRLQAFRDECVYVEGNLENVYLHGKSFHQVTLTHCPRYFEQVLKLAGPRATEEIEDLT